MNKAMHQSFEVYRRNLFEPEVITYAAAVAFIVGIETGRPVANVAARLISYPQDLVYAIHHAYVGLRAQTAAGNRHRVDGGHGGSTRTL
jgi:hypothetical protein